MNSSNHKIVLTAILISVFASCKEENLEPVPYSYEYFPVDFGKFIIYDVDSIYHADNDNNNDDSVYTWHFQMKEKIDSTFIDGQGRPAQRVMRYRRNNAAEPWTFLNVWTQTRTTTSAFRYEDNIIFHKLIFPVNPDIIWDGNDSNTLEEELYSYENVHSPRTIHAIQFDSTVSVLQRDDDNFVEKIYGYEIYAKDLGLVYKQKDNLRKLGGVVVFGTEFKMTVVTFGKE